MDLVVSALDVPLQASLKKHLRPWIQEDLDVRVFQVVRQGGPACQKFGAEKRSTWQLALCWRGNVLMIPLAMPYVHPPVPSMVVLPLHSPCLLVL